MHQPRYSCFHLLSGTHDSLPTLPEMHGLPGPLVSNGADFLPGKNETYETLFTAVIPMKLNENTRIAKLHHYQPGPVLEVVCCEFKPDYIHQVRALRKDQLGWHFVTTTAFCMTDPKPDISSYVRNCVDFALHEAMYRSHEVNLIFKLVHYYSQVRTPCRGMLFVLTTVEHPIIASCLELYTSLRLLSLPWNFTGPETLGMTNIDDPISAWHWCIPVPKMVTNQLKHLLELRMIELDHTVTKALHDLLDKRGRKTWIVGTLAVFLLVHIRELDAGRNIGADTKIQ